MLYLMDVIVIVIAIIIVKGNFNFLIEKPYTKKHSIIC